MFKKHLPPLSRRQLGTLKFHVTGSRLTTSLTEIQVQPPSTTTRESYSYWVEWVAFVHQLSEESYTPLGNACCMGGAASSAKSSSNKIRTACTNFARDHFDFIRTFSIKGFKALVAPGCPTLDPELILQKANLESCDSSSDSSVCENLIMQRKDQTSIPIKQGDWICPECSFINFARNIKCLSCNGLFEERLKSLGEHQDHLPLKKGDWLCCKCHFLNFAKNSRCLRCKEMPPKRALNPGEWECDSCNFINFRKNMICLKCDNRRHKTSVAAENTTKSLSEDDHNSAVSEILRKQEKMQHGNSIKERSPIIVERNILSRKNFHINEQRTKDGTKSNWVKSVPDINKSIKVDGSEVDCSESVHEGNMSSWFGLQKKVEL